MLILRNEWYSCPKKHLVLEVSFYDGSNKDLIPKTLAEWHRLDKFILQSGLVTSDGDFCNNNNNDGEGSEMGKANYEDASTLHAEQRRQNKQ